MPDSILNTGAAASVGPFPFTPMVTFQLVFVPSGFVCVIVKTVAGKEAVGAPLMIPVFGSRLSPSGS